MTFMKGTIPKSTDSATPTLMQGNLMTIDKCRNKMAHQRYYIELSLPFLFGKQFNATAVRNILLYYRIILENDQSTGYEAELIVITLIKPNNYESN